MKEISIDGHAFNDLTGFYDEIQRKFCPELKGFGRNLDAFNDVLRGGFDVYDYEERVRVIWIDTQTSKDDLGYDATMRDLLLWSKSDQPHISKKEFKEIIDSKIHELKTYKKPTLYDLIIDIIKDHKHIEFVED